MAKMKQLDEMANKLVPQILHKIYNTINTELAYSDLDLEGDQVSDAHDYVMTLVINKLMKQLNFKYGKKKNNCTSVLSIYRWLLRKVN